MIVDITRVRLGKAPYRHDPRTLRATPLIGAAPLTIAPTELDWFKGGEPTGMMGNDVWGDCVVASSAHLIQTWTGNATGTVVTIPDKTIIDTYLSRTGGQDTGLVMLDWMKFWKSTGLGGHKILGYALADSQDIVEMKQCELLFGGLHLGLAMPRAWQWMDVWDAVDGPDGEAGTWGGHALGKGQFEADSDVGRVCTWGYIQSITWSAIRKYGNPAVGGEVWCPFSADFLNAGVAPNRFLLAELQARQAAL